ncbi:MAG: glycosyltransferase, partial [Planctomycetes bacterium]|nr:glycosyltransferase [Planctomycetota bacterium]
MPPSVLEAAPARSKAEGPAKRKPHHAVRPIAANRHGVAAKRRRRTREKLSVLIPVYNERYTVASLIDQVMKTPLPVSVDRELIVVDDCSTDGTRDVLKRTALRYNDAIRLFEHEKNLCTGA